MNRTLISLRIFFVLLCATSGWLVCYSITDWDQFRSLAVFIGSGIGLLVVLLDLLLRGFSVRGLSAVTFGLGIGLLVADMISSAPVL